MLFKHSVLEGIARGDVTLAFRRWKRLAVSSGSRMRTALGEVLIGDVRPQAEEELDDGQARAAGFASLEELKADLRDGEDRALYRIELRGIEADRRAALREKSEIDADEAAAVAAKLRRWDEANGNEGYHCRILHSIEAAPGTAAAVLAVELGVEKLKFKRDVRKLKELGLTESLDVGYRLSQRGAALLRVLGVGE